MWQPCLVFHCPRKEFPYNGPSKPEARWLMDWGDAIVKCVTEVVKSGPISKSLAKLLDTISDQTALFLDPAHKYLGRVLDKKAELAEAKCDGQIAVTKLGNKLFIDDM